MFLDLLKAFGRIQGGPKTQFLYALTLPNVNRFSKLFHCQNQEKMFKCKSSVRLAFGVHIGVVSCKSSENSRHRRPVCSQPISLDGQHRGAEGAEIRNVEGAENEMPKP